MKTLTVRNRGSLQLVAAAGLALGFATWADAQEIVYNNTSTALGTLIAQVPAGATTGYEAGDQITLGGAGRTITQFVAYPYNLGAASAGTVQLRLYNYPGTGANPGTSGTPLFDSGPLPVNFTAGQNALTISVSNVTVPNEFVWTTQYTTAVAQPTGAGLGNRAYDPPTVGTSGNFFWANNAPTFPGWANLVFNTGNPPPVANFGATITAQNVVVSGACCTTDGSCAEITNTACAALSGAVFQGTGTTCAGTTCPLPGACCLSGGVCSFTVQSVCTAQAGAFSGVGITCAAANCPRIYQYDDNSAEDAIGFGATATNDIAFANQYLSVTGADKITGIQIAFGNDATLNGMAVTAYLWSDPNGDGSPADAQVLASLPGTVAGATTGPGNPAPTWVTFDIPDTIIPVGQKFFVGFVMVSTGQYPGAIDTASPQHKSWVGYGPGGTFNPNAWTNTTNEDTIENGNYLIRATATVGAAACYANCDNSTQPPVANIGDFTCFLQKFAAGNPHVQAQYPNCDNSTVDPFLNIADFTCFLQKFAVGCP